MTTPTDDALRREAERLCPHCTTDPIGNCGVDAIHAALVAAEQRGIERATDTLVYAQGVADGAKWNKAEMEHEYQQAARDAALEEAAAIVLDSTDENDAARRIRALRGQGGDDESG